VLARPAAHPHRRDRERHHRAKIADEPDLLTRGTSAERRRLVSPVRKNAAAIPYTASTAAESMVGCVYTVKPGHTSVLANGWLTGGKAYGR
jgi:hypothetical protein